MWVRGCGPFTLWHVCVSCVGERAIVLAVAVLPAADPLWTKLVVSTEVSTTEVGVTLGVSTPTLLWGFSIATGAWLAALSAHRACSDVVPTYRAGMPSMGWCCDCHLPRWLRSRSLLQLYVP